VSRIRLILSFDHELSLGGADSYRYNLFDPTDELLRLADELHVRLALFTDVLCAMRHELWDHDGFFVPYRNQVASALRSGHDVQLHIHPHWIDSTWSDGTYRPSMHFALSDFANASPPNDIFGIVSRAYDFLTELCRACDPAYSCVAYRAGGYNLAPETGTILTSLYRKGIRIDSSVIKGYRFSSSISQVDFSGMPGCANWTIPLSGPLGAQGREGILEVPIASKPRTPINNLPFLVSRVVHRRRAHDARGRSIHGDNTTAAQKLARMFPRSAWTLGFDDGAQSIDDVMGIFRAHVDAHRNDDEIVCAAISHPKSMGAYEFSLMRSFVRRARVEFGDQLEFCTYREIRPANLPAGSAAR
jgi:hypothetical protein